MIKIYWFKKRKMNARTSEIKQESSRNYLKFIENCIISLKKNNKIKHRRIDINKIVIMVIMKVYLVQVIIVSRKLVSNLDKDRKSTKHQNQTIYKV